MIYLFKYLCDKNEIVKSYTGLKGVYERFKFKLEKRNRINEFINKINIDQYLLVDFINMVQKYSVDRERVFPILLKFNNHSLLYRTVEFKDMLMLEITTLENSVVHFRISIKIYLDINNISIVLSNENTNSRYEYYPKDHEYDSHKYTVILKKYMLYLFENIVNGGEFE